MVDTTGEQLSVQDVTSASRGLSTKTTQMSF